MSGRWFRFYEDAVSDPKVQCLEPELFKFWVNMLCVCSKSGGSLPTIRHLSYSLRMQERKVERLLGLLVDAGLIDRADQGLEPHNWHGRQYKSDVSTERVKRFRERSSSGDETPSESDTESDTEKKKDNSASSKALSAEKRGSRLPEDFKPSEEDVAFASDLGLDPSLTAEGFRDYWHAVPGAKGRKLDWSKTFRNRCRDLAGRKQQFVSKFAKPETTTRPADAPPWETILRTYRPGGFWSPMWGERPEDIPEGRTPTQIPPTVLAAWRASA